MNVEVDNDEEGGEIATDKQAYRYHGLRYLPHTNKEILYHQAIENALANGYRVDVKRGVIYGLKGKPLAVRLHGKQRYPTVPLVTDNLLGDFDRIVFCVPAHKVVAFARWGEMAFANGVQVRHLGKTTCDNSWNSLALGSSSRNQLDKPKAVRVKAAKAARAAQPARSYNTVLTDAQMRWLQKQVIPRGPTGRVQRGFIQGLVVKWGIGKTTISQAIQRSQDGKK